MTDMTSIVPGEAYDWETSRNRLEAEIRANRVTVVLLDRLEALLREPDLVMASHGRAEIVYRRFDPPIELYVDAHLGTIRMRIGSRVTEWRMDAPPPSDAADVLRCILHPGRRWSTGDLVSAYRATAMESTVSL